MSWCLHNQFYIIFVTQQRCAVRRMSHRLFSPAHSQAEIFFMIGRSNGSEYQSPDVCPTSQTGHKRGMGRGGTFSVRLGDGLVSLFRERLKLRQDTISRPREVAVPNLTAEAQSWNQKSYQSQHSQMHCYRGGQNSKNTTTSPQTHRHGRTGTRKSGTAATVQQGIRTSVPTTDANNYVFSASLITRLHHRPLSNAIMSQRQLQLRPPI